jgi:hypothetical protein
MKMCMVQKAQLEEVPVAWSYAIMQVAFDETELKLKLDAQGTTASTMVCSAKLFARDVNGADTTCHIAMPPLVLETTSAAHILAALEARLPVTLGALAARSEGRTISGCLRLTKVAPIHKPIQNNAYRCHSKFWFCQMGWPER